MTSESRHWPRIALTHLGVWLAGLVLVFALALIVLVIGGASFPTRDIVWLLLWVAPPALAAVVVLCLIEVVMLWALFDAGRLPRLVKAALPAAAVYVGSAVMMIGFVTVLNPTPEPPPAEEDGPVELAMYAELREHAERLHARDLTEAYVASGALSTVPAAAVFVGHLVFLRRDSPFRN